MRPSAYKHIAAWCRLNEMGDAYRTRLQRKASRERAPIDAVFYSRVSPERWVTFAECGVQTRMSIERALNHGVSK